MQGDCIKYYSEIISWEKRFIKEFNPEYLSKDSIESYHILHKHLSNYEKDVYFGDIIINWIKIDNRKIKILCLDSLQISTEKNENWKEIIKTNNQYIEWDTLEDYRDHLWDIVVNSISDSITRYIQQLTWINFTDMYWVKPINIKINIKNWIAYLTVTDISCNIKNLFYVWKNIIKIQEIIKKELSESITN